MFGHRFYHGLLRKYVSIFGTLFNDIKLVRKDANDNIVQTITVPIEYSPHSKIEALRNRAKNPAEDEENDYTAIQLPRMGFEIESISYDSNRPFQATQKARTPIQSGKVNLQFIPVPYIITWNLYIVGKNQDDNLQIFESIVPFFTPDIVVAAKLIPEMGKVDDISIKLTGMNFEDDYAGGDITARRTLTWTLSFEMKCFFFGPISEQGVIKKIQVDFYIPPSGGEVTGDDIANTPRIARITQQPGLKPDGTPTTKLNETIPYMQINATDTYGFIETYQEFNDGKQYDPTTDTDKETNG